MRRIGGERGASAIEFALIVSVLFLVLFGTIQFGIAFNRVQGLHAAAREGARLGSLPHINVGQIVDRVKGAVSIVDPTTLAVGCPVSLASGQGCIDVVPSGSGSAYKPCDLRSGLNVSVTVKYRDNISIPFWGTKGVTMKGEGKFRCE